MSDAAVILVAAGLAALSGAVRSTWSPCGWSMLSSITPLGERSRGASYGVTAAWFVVGATVGGACLGALGMLLTLGAARLPLGPGARVGLAAVVLGAASLVDAGLMGVRMPVLRRQVNEDWLDTFRPWVYGAGFGWQIGTGFATYLMTAAVPGFVVLAALAGNSLVAGALGVGFGMLRGLSVLLVAVVRDPAGLARFHRSFERWGEPVRWLVAVALALASFGLGLDLDLVSVWPVGLALGLVVASVAFAGARALPRRVPRVQAGEP